MEIPLTEALTTLLGAIDRAGGRTLVVGGAVRDVLLGLHPKDLDLEVYGLDGDRVCEVLADEGFRVDAVGKAFGVLKVTGGDGRTTDLSLPRRESKLGRGHRGFLVTPDPDLSPEEAASRRDFTINSMAWDPRGGELIDVYGGREDLEARRLRHVGERFRDDPLRVLRGFGFAGRFTLTAEPATIDLCRAMLAERETLAIERVWEEWRKWAARSRTPSAGLVFLRESGWMDEHPELCALVGCPQEPEWHPEGDVWRHTLLVCDAAAEIARRDGLAEGERTVLLLAALCHDLGKPETTVRDGEGRIRSPGHWEARETFTAFLDRIGCPKAIADRVVALSRRHLDHMGFQGSHRSVRRLARYLGKHGETIASLVRLIEADHSARPPLPGGVPPQAVDLLRVAEEVRLLDAAPQRILLGRHLIELGVEPGPEMGAVLDEAYEAQLDGAFADLEGAVAWARMRITSP